MILVLKLKMLQLQLK